ncbi:hypothetical protein MHBO_003645 [Bonamia ostreae]|uniref:Prokaryotic-type class I peptide chain release factors domain-containing protein n=1 Tax=Bonamia ostreae TaxID=126728 RepID=A0ABV2AR35_9EUKA
MISIRMIKNKTIHLNLKRSFGQSFKIYEEEVSEIFQRGSGNGGRKVDSQSNCVILKHNPTGITVRCQKTRLLQKNREIARNKLADLVDFFVNKEKSKIAIAKKRRALKKAAKRRKQIRSGKYPNMTKSN